MYDDIHTYVYTNQKRIVNCNLISVLLGTTKDI